MSSKSQKSQPTRLAKISLWFYDNSRFAIALWIATLIIGTLSYSVFLKREGFPPISFPIGIAGGAYFVDDAEVVDRQITQPIADLLLENDTITDIETTATDSSFSIFATYDEALSGEDAANNFRSTIEDSGILPDEAIINFIEFDPALYQGEYDILLSVYSKDNQSSQQLETRAEQIAAKFSQVDGVTKSEVDSVFETGVNPATGQEETRQTNFSRLGVRQEDGVNFFNSIVVGLKGAEALDVTEFSQLVNDNIAQLNDSGEFDDIGIRNSADFSPAITSQIESLQSNVLTGIIAVSVISLLLITWRASIITGLFIVSVILASLLVMLVVGYTINTISLFALVLALGLFVDDATIVVEAIDAGRQKDKKHRQVVSEAVSKVAAASFAGTMTTVLVFLPLVFVTGILGEFIRILPVTIIIALVTSLVMSLTFIPFLSKFVLLTNKPPRPTPINRFEDWASDKIASLPLILRSNRRKGLMVTAAMISVSFVFFFATGNFANKVEFNIFPAAKDSDELQVEISYPPGTTINSASKIATEIDDEIATVLGENLVSSAYFDSNNRQAFAFITLTPFSERDISAPQLLDQLKPFIDQYDRAKVRVLQLGAGPPSEEFPFQVQVFGDDQSKTLPVAQQIRELLTGAQIERPNGTLADVTTTNIESTDVVARLGGERYVEFQAAFNATDTTALVDGAQKLVEANFPADQLPEGVDLGFDFGFESDNQDSFSSLALVGPIALLAMFVLLAIQFRSLLQPILIFMAIPFSFLGVFYGLYITDNPISFFSMIGFFGLIGIAVNNTILLTDYANQERRNGSPIVESISEATRKRFRPLLATSLTTVAALTPLALSDPFWVPLAVTIIFGLISSTILVIVSFPYYYLVLEGLRSRTRSRFKIFKDRN